MKKLQSCERIPFPSASLFFCLFLTSVFNHPCSAQNQEYLGCAPRLCNGTWIQYPFFPLNSSQSTSNGCGLPGLGLTCHNNNTLLFNTSTGLSFRVLGIDYASYTINLAIHPTLIRNENGCIYPTRNITLNDIFAGNPILPLNLTSLDRTENFFYHCTNNVSGTVGDPSYFNNGGSTTTYDFSSQYLHSCPNFSYAFFDDSFLSSGVQWNCQNRMNFPVLGTDSTSRRSSEMVTPALSQGFAMAWTPNSNCIDCARSGGRCGRNTTGGSFVCFCQEDTHASNCYHARNPATLKTKLTIGISAAVASLIFVCMCFLMKSRINTCCNFSECFLWNGRSHSLTSAKLEKFLNDYGFSTPTRYSYSEIKRITNKFEQKLGQGAHGSVFKGKLFNGTLVAVKIMEKSYNGGDEFINEVATIGRIHHVNVVRLLGFCVEGSRRALIYEFMANGSLDEFIGRNEAAEDDHLLVGGKLLNIALGISRGIQYLHQGCDQRIIHFDIKPNNILLDHDFTPKVSDFGLAKLYPKERSLVTLTEGKGTIGYIAPEVFYGNSRHVSHKSDVYSFGMLLLAMVGTKQHDVVSMRNGSETYFPQWIYDGLIQNQSFEGIEGGGIIAKKITAVGLWCIQWNPVDRPAMEDVVRMLESGMSDLQMPPNNFFPAPAPLNFQHRSFGSSFYESECSIQKEEIIHEEAAILS